MDASLKELTALIRDVNPDTRKKGEKGDDERSNKDPISISTSSFQARISILHWSSRSHVLEHIECEKSE
jgi:hypothetical protein